MSDINLNQFKAGGDMVVAQQNRVTPSPSDFELWLGIGTGLWGKFASSFGISVVWGSDSFLSISSFTVLCTGASFIEFC